MTKNRLPTLALLPLLLGACRAGDIGGNVVRNAMGGSGRAGDVVAAGFQGAMDMLQQTAIRFSPEQEFYLGRAVAANWIARYGLDPDEGRQAYVRRIGGSIVALSARIRTTWGGWHFGVLNGATPNGMSAPGGFVFVTRAALDLARSEDEVAGILAHEIAHVSLKHGEKILRDSEPWKAALGAAGRVIGAAGGGARMGQQMYELFTEAADGVAKSIVEQGYGRDLEYRADAEGSFILYDSGYDGGAIASYLKSLPDRPATAWAVHPANADRIEALAPIVAQYGGPFDGGLGAKARLARFQSTLAAK